MRITTAILAVLATAVMVSSTPSSLNQARAATCPCYPNCGCDAPTVCLCLGAGTSPTAPCYPNCGCPAGQVGVELRLDQATS